MARFFREDFDRERTFVVAREFTYGGTRFVSGQAVDKGLFTVRRLRQLYDMRHIQYGTATPVAPPQPSTRRVERYRPKDAAA